MNCAICDHTITDTLMICARCHNRICDNLTTIQTLTIDAARWERRRGSSRLVAVASSNPPTSVSLIDAASGQLCISLERFEQLGRKQLNQIQYGPATLARAKTTSTLEALTHVIAWLMVHLPRLEGLDAYPIDELHDETQTLANQLRNLDPENDDVVATIIKCPADHPRYDGNCDTRLRINPEQLNKTIDCPTCHTAWTLDRLINVALSVPNIEVWADAAWLTKWFGVTQRILDLWVREKRITKRGELYSIPDAFRTAQSSVNT